MSLGFRISPPTGIKVPGGCAKRVRGRSAHAIAWQAPRHISASERLAQGRPRRWQCLPFRATCASLICQGLICFRNSSLRLGSALISVCKRAGMAAAMSELEAYRVIRAIAARSRSRQMSPTSLRAPRMTHCRNHSAKAQNTQMDQRRRRHRWATMRPVSARASVCDDKCSDPSGK